MLKINEVKDDSPAEDAAAETTPLPASKAAASAKKKAPAKKSGDGKLTAGDTVDFDLDGQGSLF